MKEIMLLTLYKQHYLDKYITPLQADTSCLGYYDGLSITDADKKMSGTISSKMSKAPMPEMWYAAGKSIEGMKGGYSNQNIGLFRCFSDKEMDKTLNSYWEMEKELPFIHVGFVKLQSTEQYEEVAKKIEGIRTEIEGKNRKKICNVIVYCTYDNADLVVLARGNSLTLMNEVFRGIEGMEEVSYLHSIIGIDEEYIKACTGAKNILKMWRGMECFIDEPIDRIELRMVTSGESKILNMIKGELKKWNEAPWRIKGYEQIKYAYIAGHGNIEIVIPGTNVATLLVLLLKNGFVTHQNTVYEKGLYNIESSIVIKEEEWKEINEQSVEYEADKNMFGWCRAMMNKCADYLGIEGSKTDESLYSYFQALMQTLNTLDQYERFGMSRDIFDLIFPSFEMFFQKMEKVIFDTDGQTDCFEVELVKEAMWQYLEDVNSVIYHTIHTDQIYLMIPGYSGTSFSIPIKLSLFYSWFMKNVIRVSNDGARTFSYILIPVTESKPSTCAINMSRNESEILICVRLSRRSLYFPRNLMLILGHELGHYVSSSTRCRKARLQNMIKTLSYLITEKLFPIKYKGEVTCDREQKIFDGLKAQTRKQIQEALADIMRRKEQLKCPDDKYHAKDIEGPLVNICTELISATGVGRDVCDAIYKIPPEILGFVEKDEQNYVASMRYIWKIQKQIDNNRARFFASGNVRNYIRILIEVYQEVFADIFAVAILKCDQETYHEAFSVSEGVAYENEHRPIQQKVREQIIESVVFQQKDIRRLHDMDDAESYDRSMETSVPSGKDWDEVEAEEVLTYGWTDRHLNDYAQECYSKMLTWLEQCEYSQEVGAIRSMYTMFTSEYDTASRIYKQMNQCIVDYKACVTEMYQKTVQDKFKDI